MFLAKENGLIIAQDGDGASRHSPCSTFKIALSLMAYNEKLLQDETHPEHPCTPSAWIQNSYVWYSQLLTQQMGLQKLSHYLALFNYGNQDLSGDSGQNNALTQSWLSSSLKISPEEQVSFLERLLNNQLPVSSHAHEMTQKILFIENLPHHWALYGKTGTGSLDTLQQGWFVGWIQKENRTIIFALYLEDEGQKEMPAGKRAKERAKEKLMTLILSLEIKDYCAVETIKACCFINS